jgi:hypothetical protein
VETGRSAIHKASPGRWAVEVCAEEAEQFLIEGCELSPAYLPRLQEAIGGVEIRACFLGNCVFSAELLAAYRGPKPQHEKVSGEELKGAAAWIRQRSHQLRAECRDVGLPYVDVGELGFESALREARHLVAPLADQSMLPETHALHLRPHNPEVTGSNVFPLLQKPWPETLFGEVTKGLDRSWQQFGSKRDRPSEHLSPVRQC